MRILLIIQFLLFSPAYSQQLQDNNSDFQHEGLTEDVINEACQDLGEKCRKEADRSSGALEDVINQGPKLAFSFLVPATIASLIRADGNLQVKSLWDFKSIGNSDYIAETLMGMPCVKSKKTGTSRRKQSPWYLKKYKDSPTNPGQ